jgi:hypothetical protein
MNCREFTEDELKWLKSLNRVMKKAPDTLFMFVGAGQVIYPKDENNNRYQSDIGGVLGCDEYFMVDTPMEMDGGDY